MNRVFGDWVFKMLRSRLSACRGPDERYPPLAIRAAPVGELLVEQRPCMDHVWPNLQRDPNIRRAGPRGDLDRIVISVSALPT